MRKIFLAITVLCVVIQAAALCEEAVRLYFFYTPTCLKCLAVRQAILNLQEKYPLKVKYFNIEKQKNYEALLLMEKKYRVRGEDVPEIFAGDAAYIGKTEIMRELEPKIQDLLAKGGSDWPDQLEGETEGLIEERFATFTLFPVMLAGLIDGINPCAFATIVFFVSFLTFIGRKKKEILVIGTSFTAAVFTAYLLLGLGIFRFLHTVEVFFLISQNIYYGVGIIAFALGILNLYDYYRYKNGQISEMTLQLPRRAKQLIHLAVRANQNTHGAILVLTAVLTGFVVSVLESICTGQVYLPTIVFILQTQGFQGHALTFLIIYNLMFILPLVVIFALTLFGVTSEWLGKVIKRNLGVTKILTALFFFVLGSLLFLM